MQNPTNQEKKEVIQRYLADPRFSGGRDRLYANIREQYPTITRREVAAVLAEDGVHQQHRSLNKRITSRPIIVNGPARAAQVDLIDTQGESGKNDNTRYLLTYVDLFSKWCAVRPLKNKTTVAVIAGLADILDNMPEAWRPTLVQSDRGSEFKAAFEAALHQRGIKTIHSAPYAPQTQGAIERFNRTLKSTLFELMTRHNTRRYIDFIEPLVENLNNTKHGTTGFKPIDIMNAMPLDAETIELIHNRMRKKIKRSTQSDKVFDLGDFVRVAVTTESAIRKTEKFRKKIDVNWSSIIYRIYAISEPEAAATQPQYLLFNLTTNRKSKKRYFGYQLQQITRESAEANQVAAPEEDDDDEDDDRLPELIAPSALPGEPNAVRPAVQVENGRFPVRRTGRQWRPSAQALQNLAH